MGVLSLVAGYVANIDKMEALIARLTKLLEPIIIVGMGVTVAGLMMSMACLQFTSLHTRPSLRRCRTLWQRRNTELDRADLFDQVLNGPVGKTRES